MANTVIKDGNESTKFVKSKGAGTDLDPYVFEQDINVQDQSTRVFVASMSQEEASTTISAPTAIDDYSYSVTDPTGFVIGGYVSIFDLISDRFYVGEITNVAASVITVDTPLDFAFPAGSFATSGTTNMAVNGSPGSPEIFGLRNTEDAVGKTFDITRIMFVCLTNGNIDLSMFGDIAGGLTNGIVFRKKDGIYNNIFNAKTNADLKNLMYDFQIQLAAGSAQDGFTGRLTFSGQDKMGVVIRLAPGEDIQMIIRDDLSSLENFRIIAQGHEVE